MTKDEALKLALEALEANQPVNYCVNSKGEKFPMSVADPFKFQRCAEAITAIKEALAQPEQKPDIYPEEAYEMGLEAIAYYAAPPQRTWVGLTGEDFSAIKFSVEMRFPAEFRAGARWAEAKLKEKNFD